MEANERSIQRLIDGELQSAEAQAVQRMLEQNAVLKQQFEAEQAFDELLLNAAQYVDDDGQHQRIQSIMEAVPHSAPLRKASFSIAQLAFVAILVVAIVGSYALAGSSNIGDIIPVSLITISSLVLGSLLLFMARPLQRLVRGGKAASNLSARFLRQRLSVGQADVLAYRCAGIAIILGGAYLML